MANNFYARMFVAGPLWKAMRDIFRNLTLTARASKAILMGLNPHLADDTTNTAAAALPSIDSSEEARDSMQALYVAYEAHRASATHHAAADATNTLAAEPTPKAVYDLLNQIKAKYNAHRANVAGAPAVHGAADSTNVVDAADATTKASAITLANQLKAKINAHMVNITGSVHGAADNVNTIVYIDAPANATWAHLQALADQIKAQYEAHRVILDDSIHGSADATNAVTQEDVGDVNTRDIACVNDLKAKLNAHIILATAHKIVDLSVKVVGGNAVTAADAIVLTKEVTESYKNHISRARYFSEVPTVEAI